MGKQFSKLLIVLAGLVLASGNRVAYAAPQISTVAGNIAHGERLEITGSDFGQKSPAKPLLWAPFDGTASPSPLGIVGSWDRVQSMGYRAGEGYGGTGALGALDSSGSWVAGVTNSGVVWNAYGAKMYLFRRVKRNFEVTPDLNWKIFRIWPASWTAPDWFIQSGNGNLEVEGVAEGSAFPYDSGIVSPIRGGNLQAVRGRANVWRTEEILVKVNTSARTSDTEFYHYVLGSGLVGVIPYTNYTERRIKIRDADSNADMTIVFPVHGVRANVTFPSSYRYWVDDVYLDTTWARVMVGDAPKLSDCTHLEVQIPYEWTASRIGVTLNLQTFPAGATPYLFVVDAAQATSLGFELADVTRPSPPAGVVVE